MTMVNGLPLVQIELKTLDVSPRRAMQQIVDYKNDVGNGYANSLLCFMQMFIVSNRTNTYYFATTIELTSISMLPRTICLSINGQTRRTRR